MKKEEKIISLVGSDQIVRGARWEYSSPLHNDFRYEIKKSGGSWNGKYWDLESCDETTKKRFFESANITCEKKDKKLKIISICQDITLNLTKYTLGDEVRYHLTDSTFIKQISPIVKVQSDFLKESALQDRLDFLDNFNFKIKKDIITVTEATTPLYFTKEMWKINIHINQEDIYHRFLTDISAHAPEMANNYKSILPISINEWNSLYKPIVELLPTVGLLPDEIPEPTSMKLDYNKIKGWDKDSSGHVLRDYQKEGILHIAKCHGRALIADEMGTGKTVQALSFCAGAEVQRVLIVCPVNARYVWDDHIRKWLDDNSIFHVESAKDIINITDEKWIISSYSIVGGRTQKEKKEKKIVEKKNDHINKLVNLGFDTMICDEAHYLKNSDSKRSKSAKKLSTNVKNVILLTGTPIRNRADEHEELVTLLNSADAKYSEGRKFYMIRRYKKDILKQLPDKTREWINFDIEIADYSNKRFFYDNALAWAENEYFTGYETSEKMAKQRYLAALAKANSIAGAMKAADPKILELIKQIVEEKGSCLVFCKHHDAIDTLSNKLQNAKISHVKIDGRSSSVDRKNAEIAFQNGKADVFLGSIGAAGEALTLTRADTCVFVEFDWVPAAMLQAEDRGHRIGQESDK